MNSRLPYVVLPVGLLFLPYVFYATFEDLGFYFAKESGAVENITAILLAAAIGVVIWFLMRLLAPTAVARALAFRKLTILWCIIYCLGCVYFLGEEISWGQHLFGWETPDAWMEINDQGETNFHNTSGWFDQVPRTILTLGIVIGGFIYPLIQRRRAVDQSSTVAAFLNHFMPGWNCVWAGGCIVGREILGAATKATNIEALGIADGEVKESLIAAFLLIYIVDLFCRTGTQNLPVTDVQNEAI